MPARPLTQRQLEILSLVANGFSNKMIASRLGIKEHTVTNILAHVFDKMGVSDRTHAVVQAYRSGALDLQVEETP